MEILFSGNKPQKKTYSYSVKENNNSNIITFILNKEIEGLDLSSLSCYVKVQGSEIDKDIPTIKVEEEQIKVNWTLQRKHTISRVLKVQLQFEGTNDIVWQSEIVEIVLSDTIKADKYIENKYPAVLTNHEERITTLEEGGQPTPTKESKEFVFVKRKGKSSLGELEVILKSNVNCAFTGANKTRSKGQWINCYGTKLGNRDWSQLIEQGKYSMEDFLSRLFDKEFNVVKRNEMEYSINVLFPAHFIEDTEKIILYHTTIDFVADYGDHELLTNEIRGFNLNTKTFIKMSNKFLGFLEELDDLVYQTKVMVKFVKDFEKVTLPKRAEMCRV